MTEIPEHLLRRSRERRQALGLPTEGGEAALPATSASTSSESAPAETAAAAPPAPPARPPRGQPAVAPLPKPAPPYVAAAERRRKIPLWAMPVLALLPLWAFMYALAMRPPEKKLTGPLAVGAEVYGQCSSCHGARGEGGVGYPFVNGDEVTTFPNIEDNITFVSTGSQVHAGEAYGDPNRPGGPHIGLARNGIAMPAFGTTLSKAEITAVVCYERYVLGGADQTSDEFLQWCAADVPKYVEAEAAG